MILIISFVDNDHVRRVTEHLKSGHEVVDLAWFPSRMRMHAYARGKLVARLFALPECGKALQGHAWTASG